MSKLQMQVQDFHTAMGQQDPARPTSPTEQVAYRRARICLEEFAELGVALVGADEALALFTEFVIKTCRKRQHRGPGGLPEIVDACADSSVVVAGTLLEVGVVDGPVHDEVMRANMAKVGGGKDEHGKFQKPPGWQPPDIDRVLFQQGWQGEL